jgi:hypothetical protein
MKFDLSIIGTIVLIIIMYILFNTTQLHVNNLVAQSYEPQSYEPQSYEPQSYEPQSYEPQSYDAAIGVFGINNNVSVINNGIELCTVNCDTNVNREPFANPLDSIKKKITDKAEKVKKDSEKGKGKTISKLKDKEKDFAEKATRYSKQGQHITGKIKSKLFGWLN